MDEEGDAGDRVDSGNWAAASRRSRVVHDNKVWQFSVEEQLEKLVRGLGSLHSQARVKSAAEMSCTKAASCPQTD